MRQAVLSFTGEYKWQTRTLVAALAGVVLAAVLASLVFLPWAWAATSSVKVLGSATTVRPDKPTPTDGAITPGPNNPYKLTAAKNEFESFQIVVEAGDQEITGLEVQKDESKDPDAKITGPNGAAIPNSNVTVYREDNYDVKTVSDGEGATGLWPDALIPEKDYLYKEDRNAFPVKVPANTKVVIWVDVLVPKTATAGSYSGTLTLKAAGGLTQTPVPFDLKVLNFELPSTSSLESAFPTSYGAACKAHTGYEDCNGDQQKRWLLHSLYAQAGLENRVTISNPVPLGTDEGPPTGQNLTYFNQYIAPLLKKDVHNTLRLPDAKLTSFSVYTYNQADHCKPACVDQWETFANSNGFAERMFLYSCDEAGTSATKWAACNTALKDQTGLRKLATGTVDQAKTAGYSSNIDILTPNVLRMDDKVDPYKGNQRSKYDEFLATAGTPKNELWLYTSCMSFGCVDDENNDGVLDPERTGPYWNGWPGYAIDQPATESRAMGWMLFKYDATGELYWQTTQMLNTAWTDLYYRDEGGSGNGDGTLFYPGTPAKIGGTKDIPVESIRLKRIRDGREDYEYLKQLADPDKGNKKADAETIVNILFPSMHQTDVTQTTFDKARNDLIGKIEPLLPPISDPLPTDCQSATKSSEGVTGTGTWSDPLRGTSGDDVIVGTPNDDLIEGLGGNDLLCGRGGYDSFIGGPGDDTIDGEDASNAVYYEGGEAPAVGVNVDLAAGKATGHGTDKLSNINEVYGTQYDDVIKGDDKENALVGNGGNDTLIGGGGDDYFEGEGGDDDTIDSRDGAKDAAGWVPSNPDYGINCGPGTDTVEADVEDADEINPDCEPDATPPGVSLTAPADGATVSGSSVTLSADATDDTGVSRVDFYVGSTKVGSDTTAGGTSGKEYSTSWDSTSVSDGSQPVTARAYDAANNEEVSSSRTVTVKNNTFIPPPSGNGGHHHRPRHKKGGRH